MTEQINTLVGHVSKLDGALVLGDIKFDQYYEAKKQIIEMCKDEFEETLDFYDIKKRVEICKKYGQSELPPMVEGMMLLQTGSYYFFVKPDGEKLSEKTYRFAKNFSEGLAYVTDEWNTHGSNEGYFIDNSGKRAFPETYNGDIDSRFSDGFARVQTLGLGEPVKCFFINKMGERVFSDKYSPVGDFSEGFAPVREKGKTFFIDIYGKRASKDSYDGASSFSEGLARVRDKGRHFFVDKEFRKIGEETYLYAEDFVGGFAKVKNTDAGDGWEDWFYIGRDGKKISHVDDTYRRAGDFSDGFAKVSQDNAIRNNHYDHFLIDEKGNKMNIKGVQDFTDYSEGRAFFRKDYRWFLMDNQRKLVTKKGFEDYSRFVDGVAPVKDTYSGDPYYINRQGKRVYPEEEPTKK
jgi:hypothetical protein